MANAAPLISFRSDRCNIPVELLRKEERELLDQKGYQARFSRGLNFLCYHNVRILDFPGIFYSTREVPFYKSTLPVYVQAFLRRPRDYGGWKGLVLNEKDDSEHAYQLRRDFERFPLDPFYEHLFCLRDIKVVFDEKETTHAGFEEPMSVVFGQDSKGHYFDPAWFNCTFLHELYHFVELDLGEKVTALFGDMPQWQIKQRVDAPWRTSQERKQARATKYSGLNIHEIKWRDSDLPHLAEVLAALTMVKHPEIISETKPYYPLLDDSVTGQLSLPGFGHKEWWYEE